MRASISAMIIAFLMVSTAFAQNGEVIVDISGIRSTEGALAIGLFDKADSFPDVSKAYRGVLLKVTGKHIHFTFSGIPSGEYAIAVFHDSNGNGRVDKNFLGIPNEGYAFSRNAAGTFGPPDFSQAAFTLDDTYTAKIEIKY